MFNQIIYFITAVLGVTLCIAYYVRRHIHKVSTHTSALVRIVLHSALIVNGLVLVLSTFYDEWKAKLTENNIYILVSGIFVFVVEM